MKRESLLIRIYLVVLTLSFLGHPGAWLQAATTNEPPRQLETVATNAPPAVAVPAVEHSTWVTFGLDSVSVLREPLFGEPRWKYLSFIVFILLALATSKLLDWLVTGRLKAWAGQTETKVDDLVLELGRGPIKVVSFVIFLHIGLQVFAWPSWVQDYLSKGLRIVVAWSLTYMVLKAVDMMMEFWRRRVADEADKAFNDQFFPLVRKSIKVFIAVVAILLTSQNLGLNITSVIASLSIGGLALGLAAQDTIANLFGAVAIFADRPFRIGDRIKLDSVDGVVETIGLRSTRVRSLDGFLITVPNKTMGGATITNVSRRPTIKTEMNLGITYEATPEKVRRAVAILEEVYKRHPMTADLLIGFNKFDSSALNIYVVHWWNSTDFKAYLAGMQEMNLKIKQRFDEAEIGFAYPTQTLYMKQDSDWRFVSGNMPGGGSRG